MKTTIFVCFLLSLALFGCSTSAPVAEVAEPLSGERARLRVISDQTVYLIPGHCAVLGPGSGHVSGFKGRSLGMPTGPTQAKNGNVAELYVKAGSPLSLVSSRQGCTIRGSFVPKANEDYEVVVEFSWGSSKCSLQAWKIGKENTPIFVTLVPYNSPSCR